MKTGTVWFAIGSAFLMLPATAAWAQGPAGTAFTYQGQLKESGSPVTGTADFEFSLWDAATAGEQVGSTQALNGVSVENGLFTVLLDFGAGAFNGQARWLQIAARVPAGGGTWWVLEPRQELTGTPYALYGLSGGGGDLWQQNGPFIYYNAGNVGIGTDTPGTPLCVAGGQAGGGLITGINSVLNDDNPAVRGQHAVGNGRGTGVMGVGGYQGVVGQVTATTPSFFNGFYGVSGSVSGDAGTGTKYGVKGYAIEGGVNYGLYGFASAGTNNYGVYGYAGGGENDRGVWGVANSFEAFAGYFEGRGYFSQTLGLGTTTPNMNQKLHVVGSSLFEGETRFQINGGDFTVSTPGGWPGLVMHSPSGFRRDLLLHDDGLFLLASDSSSPPGPLSGLFIGNQGWVGINTNTPQSLLDVHGEATVDVLTIRGGSDLAEKFDITQPAQPGMVVVIDPDHAGQLKLATSAYDRKVAGIVSGAKGLSAGMVMSVMGTPEADGQHPVALTGRVWCWCDTSPGSIAPGDLLTTSDVPGHAMKVVDYGQAQGAILGKAMTSLAEGRGLVLVLVSLQ